jgi:hypothetical protein
MPSRRGAEPVQRLLTWSGTLLVLSYVFLFVLQQSHTLWSRAVPLPGGEDGPFGAFRKLFHPGWLNASRALEVGFTNALVYILLLGWLFGVYLFAVKKAFQSGTFKDHDGHERSNDPLRVILVTAALILMVLVVLPGTFSADLHSYVWYGRIFAIYGDNPFIHIPSEYAARDADGWLELVYWTEVPSVYGPVWVLLAGGIAIVAEWLGGGIGTHLMGHRLLAALAHLGNSLLIWRVAGLMLKRYGAHLQPHAAPGSTLLDWRRGRQIAATLAYAWNPLALIEFGANGHNDVLLLTGLLACLWFNLLGRWRLAVVALASAALIKAVTIIWLPGYLWLLFWGPLEGRSVPRLSLAARLGRITQAIAITLLVWVAGYLPFWEGPATLQPLADGPAATRLINSLGQFVYLKLPEGVQHMRAELGLPLMNQADAAQFSAGLTEPIRWAALLITAGIAGVFTWRARNLPGMIHAWGWGGFVYLTVGAVWFWPWYASWLLVPVALLGWGRLMIATQILCATSLSLYAIYPDVPEHLKDLPTWRALITVSPAVTYSLATLTRRRALNQVTFVRNTAMRSKLGAKV